MKLTRQTVTVFVTKSESNQPQALVNALNKEMDKLDKDHPEWRNFPSEVNMYDRYDVCDTTTVSIKFSRYLTDAELNKEKNRQAEIDRQSIAYMENLIKKYPEKAGEILCKLYK